MAKSVARDLAFVKSKVISRLLESDEFAKVMLRKEDFTDDEKLCKQINIRKKC